MPTLPFLSPIRQLQKQKIKYNNLGLIDFVAQDALSKIDKSKTLSPRVPNVRESTELSTATAIEN
jgi:hypothetical protein